ncbi:MAG: hypothetical protein PHX43_05030 [Alphaproteobacteria bacterium]|nr:hypothetical protein [Alphaproteobacteria bacterium]
MTTDAHKPGYDEWKNWVEIIIDRLTSAVHVYNKPPYHDVYLPDNERQLKVESLVDLLRRLHSLIDNNSSLAERAPAEIAAQDETVISKLQPYIKDVLRRLPTTSHDMQHLLKSPWESNCTGRVATEIFCGTDKRLNEGIGSGKPEHGRLPEILVHMLEREQIGDARPPREDEHETAMTRSMTQPHHRKKTSFGSAGRVD